MDAKIVVSVLQQCSEASFRNVSIWYSHFVSCSISCGI